MSFEQILFYFFAAVVLGGALGVITARNPVHAALFLVLTFGATAAIWLLAEAEFLAITLVLVYVGAVMVLFLFVVMMLDINLARLRAGFTRYLPLGALVAVLLVGLMFLAVGPERFGAASLEAPPRHGPEHSNTEALGSVLYTDYVYPFEIAAVILLVAIVAAIALTMRRRPQTKYQDPARQVRVRKAERLRVVKMDADKR